MNAEMNLTLKLFIKKEKGKKINRSPISGQVVSQGFFSFFHPSTRNVHDFNTQTGNKNEGLKANTIWMQCKTGEGIKQAKEKWVLMISHAASSARSGLSRFEFSDVDEVPEQFILWLVGWLHGRQIW